MSERKIDLRQALQPVDAPAPAPQARAATPSSRSWVLTLVLSLGLALIGVGIGRWWETLAPRQTAADFFEAVRAGDRDRAVSLLIPMQQRLAQHPKDADQLNAWQPSPKLACKIEQVCVKGARATVVVQMSDGDARVRPTLELARNRRGEWRIASIDGFETEPVWTRAERERREAERQQQADQNQQISHDLIEALDSVPGVAVHRDTVRETSRR